MELSLGVCEATHLRLQVVSRTATTAWSMEAKKSPVYVAQPEIAKRAPADSSCCACFSSLLLLLLKKKEEEAPGAAQSGATHTPQGLR